MLILDLLGVLSPKAHTDVSKAWSYVLHHYVRWLHYSLTICSLLVTAGSNLSSHLWPTLCLPSNKCRISCKMSTRATGTLFYSVFIFLEEWEVSAPPSYMYLRYSDGITDTPRTVRIDLPPIHNLFGTFIYLSGDLAHRFGNVPILRRDPTFIWMVESLQRRKPEEILVWLRSWTHLECADTFVACPC